MACQKAAANRQPGTVPAISSASLKVSTSVSSGAMATRRPAEVSLSICWRPVSGRDIGTPASSDQSGLRRPSSQNPPSVAGPNTASASPEVSDPAASASNRGVTCGVSMPTSTMGSGSVAWVSANAAASRSSRPPPRCGMTSNPAGSQSPRAPSSASTWRLTGAAATAASVSASAASANSAASAGVNGGVSLVLTRPGTGSLAITTACAASAPALMLRPPLASCRKGGEHSPHVADRPHGAAHRAGHLGLADSGVVRHRSLADSPARGHGAHHHLQRVPEPPVPQVKRQQVSAPGGPHRAEVVQRHPGAAPEFGGKHHVAEPRVGRPRGRRGRRAPTQHQVDHAVRDRTADDREVGRLERTVRVHDADDVAGRGQQPRVAGGAEPALRDVHDRGAVLGGDPRRAVRGAVVGHDRPESGGHPGEQPGQCAGLVEARQHHVDGFHGADASGALRLWPVIGPYGTVTAGHAGSFPSPRGAWLAAMRVLVTGAAGFIGSHVMEAVAAAGYEVRGLDSLSPAVHDGRPSYLPNECELRVADVRDPVAVDDALDGVDAVCHLAAIVGLGVSLADLPLYTDVNVTGTAVLLDAMGRRGVSRLVLSSSMVVYGEGAYECPLHGGTRPLPRAAADLEAGVFEPRCPVCDSALSGSTVGEDATLDPQNAYATSKVAQEHLAANWARLTGGAAVALRYHNVYGPRMPRDTPYSGVAAIFRSCLESGIPPRVFEDGAQRRDFVHVCDVAECNVLALHKTGSAVPAGTLRAYNVASGTPHTVG